MDRELSERMAFNIRLAKSFRPYGDTWWMEAEDCARELEAEGHTVLDDWTVLFKDEPCPIRAERHWELEAE